MVINGIVLWSHIQCAMENHRFLMVNHIIFSGCTTYIAIVVEFFLLGMIFQVPGGMLSFLNGWKDI